MEGSEVVIESNDNYPALADICTLQVLYLVFVCTHLCHIGWCTLRGLYQFLTMVDTDGPQTSIHPHVNQPLYHCATDADH